jgi:hypothetical protein
MKLVRLIKMCRTETYTRVQEGKHLSDMFPVRNGLKQGDALLSLLSTFALEYTIRRVQVNQYQLLVFAYDVSIMGRSLHTKKKKQKL